MTLDPKIWDISMEHYFPEDCHAILKCICRGDKYSFLMEEHTGYTQNRKERSFTKKAFITSPLVNFDHLKLYSCYRVNV